MVLDHTRKDHVANVGLEKRTRSRRSIIQSRRIEEPVRVGQGSWIPSIHPSMTMFEMESLLEDDRDCGWYTSCFL